jgi:hypothetical protein
MTIIKSYMTPVISSLNSGSLVIKFKATSCHVPREVWLGIIFPYDTCLADLLR